MKIAQIQMRVTSDKTENLRRAAALIRAGRPGGYGRPAGDVLLPL